MAVENNRRVRGMCAADRRRVARWRGPSDCDVSGATRSGRRV